MDGVANPLISDPRVSYIEKVAPFFDASAIVDDAPGLHSRAATDGYLFCRDLAPRSAIADLWADVLKQCAQRGWVDESVTSSSAMARPLAHEHATRDALLALQADIQVLPSFSALRNDTRIASMLETVLGEAAAAGCGDVCRVAFPRDLARTTLPHQDYFYTRGSTSLWTVWIPLSDCPSPLGGLAVLPGSHAGGLRAHDGGEGESRYIVADGDLPWAGADFRVGDVLMFNALTVHGARPNITEREIRVSADFRYRPVSYGVA